MTNNIAPNVPGLPVQSPRIGLDDIETEGTFVWSTGEPTSFQNWTLNEPDNFGNADSVALGGFGGFGGW